MSASGLTLPLTPEVLGRGADGLAEIAPAEPLPPGTTTGVVVAPEGELEAVEAEVAVELGLFLLIDMKNSPASTTSAAITPI
jgi:hypothetical protein